MDELKVFLLECAQEEKVVFLKFGARWCNPCKKIMPTFEKLMNEYSKTNQLCYLDIDIDKYPEISDYFQIESIPIFYVFLPDATKNKSLVSSNEHELTQFVASCF